MARLRLLNQMRAHSEVLEFKIGDRVAFRPSGQGRVEGMLTRYNKKTVTVVTDGGERWNVSPGLLRVIRDHGDASDGQSNAVAPPKK